MIYANEKCWKDSVIGSLFHKKKKFQNLVDGCFNLSDLCPWWKMCHFFKDICFLGLATHTSICTVKYKILPLFSDFTTQRRVCVAKPGEPYILGKGYFLTLRVWINKINLPLMVFRTLWNRLILCEVIRKETHAQE